MKKLISTFMIVTLLICCFTATAFASDQTVLTTTVPDATYTLNIPDDQEVPFGATKHDLGEISVTDAAGFAKGKDLKVVVEYDDFKSEDVATTIPYQAGFYTRVSQPTVDTIESGEYITFLGTETGEVGSIKSEEYVITGKMTILASSSDWGKALAGDYSSTITFTAEVVSSNQ